jgi:hypothetical protein
MRVLYNGWERWITTMEADIKIGDGSKKTFQTVMGSWREDILQTSKMGEKQDDEETWGLEGGYLSDRGISRHSIDFKRVSAGKTHQVRVKENRKKKGNTLMGRIKGVYHCLQDQQQGFAKNTVMMC